MSDPREAASRYRLDREARERGEEPQAKDASVARASTVEERAAIIESAIQQAIRAGEFDDLPGAGKPIPGLGESHDPDWWIRRKIESEQLTGLGPPALTLRTEYAELAAREDQWRTEGDVRDYLADFNLRVIEARRQLLGGPPVVTPMVDIDERLRGWRSRRDAAARAIDDAAAAASVPSRRRLRWRRPPG